MNFVFSVSFLINSVIFSEQIDVEYHIDQRTQPCTYFESQRYAFSESGLVNCSWYSQKSCCKRTEVTSVFSKMMPLYGATTACKNQINYMMCYFCDPNQCNWYNQDTEHKVHVCADFCRMVYTSCGTAQFNGTAINDVYKNETAFCEAQNFRLVEGKKNCFNYDPTVFGSTTLPCLNFTTMAMIITMAIMLRNIFN